MLIKILRFIASILFLPVCFAVTISFYEGIVAIKAISDLGILFILGAFLYSSVHLLLFKFNFLYVLGHELMHAIATFLSGGKVKHIRVSSAGGSIGTTTPNIFVILAPYLIPGYTVFIAALYFGLSFITDVTRYSNIFIFFTGFSLMFHLAYTADGIRKRQSDLLKTGYLFSISFIYVVNLVIVFFVISFLFKEVSFLDFVTGACNRSKDFYYSFWRQLFQ